MKYVVSKYLAHNIYDRAVYTEAGLAFSIFFETAGFRKIGIYNDCKNDVSEIMLLAADGCNLEILPMPEDADDEQLISLYNIREQWLFMWSSFYKKKCDTEMRAIFDAANSPISRRQAPVNFKKEIIKRMEKCTKMFRNRNMEGYDFREIPLSQAVFINCNLKDANMAGVDLTDSIFINCKINGMILYNAIINNAFVYSDCSVEKLKNLKKGAVFNVKN